MFSFTLKILYWKLKVFWSWVVVKSTWFGFLDVTIPTSYEIFSTDRLNFTEPYGTIQRTVFARLRTQSRRSPDFGVQRCPIRRFNSWINLLLIFFSKNWNWFSEWCWFCGKKKVWFPEKSVLKLFVNFLNCVCGISMLVHVDPKITQCVFLLRWSFKYIELRVLFWFHWNPRNYSPRKSILFFYKSSFLWIYVKKIAGGCPPTQTPT